MPLTVADKGSPNPGKVPPARTILIFYSSVVDGQLWCPDCRSVDPLIKNTFETNEEWHGIIVYVGDRPTWRDPENQFRKQWKVSNIPTLIRLDGEGKELARLVESEITKTRLNEFLNL